MTWESQHNALRDRFDTQWANTTPIAWPNVTFDPPDAAAWVRFVATDATARTASFGDPGNNVHRHTGLLTLMIFVPVNTGDKEALELADQASAIFRGWQDAASGLRFRQPPFVRQVGPDRKWYQVNVLCPFERDEHL